MTWAQQRQLIRSLSSRAHGKKRDARHARGGLKVWTTSYLGCPETLVWLFAMGSFWAAGRFPQSAGGATGRSLIAAVNTSLLAWQLVNRQVKLAQPAADHPSEAQR